MGAIGGALVLAAALLLAPHLFSGTELVRLRNALSLGPDLSMADDWTPDRFPPGFRRERLVDPFFSAVGEKLALSAMPDDWARAVAISRHLLSSAPQLNGGPAKSDLRRTYTMIVERGDGYCGDFVRVFMATANAAGMTVRPWSFAFDGFGGHGHIWAEVWNRQLARWQLLDVFNNHYFVAAEGVPLSALDVKRALATGHEGLRLKRLDPRARAYDIEAKAWAYYERGLTQWYAPWGNDVQTVDAGWPTRVFSGVSRALEQGVSILAGMEPEVRMLAEPANAAQRAAMRSLRSRVIAAGVMGGAGCALLLGALLWRGRARPAAEGAATAGRAGGR